MSACNIVRIQVKPGHEESYLDIHRNRDLADMPGMKSLRVVETGEGEYVMIGEWTDMDAMAAARPSMTAVLDQFRDSLEDLGGDLGVTDPRSGEAVIERQA